MSAHTAPHADKAAASDGRIRDEVPVPERRDTAESAASAYLGRSAGAPLDSSVRRDLEASFGTTLDDVRVHDEPPAAQAADGLFAQAFTHRNHIAFNRGRYAPHTLPGRRLIAHEVAHVLQQRAFAHTSRAATTLDAESEADAAATRAAGGESAGIGAHASGVQCKPLSATEISELRTMEMVEQRIREAELELAEAKTDAEFARLRDENLLLKKRLTELTHPGAPPVPASQRKDVEKKPSLPAPLALTNDINEHNVKDMTDAILQREVGITRRWLAAYPPRAQNASLPPDFVRASDALIVMESEQVRRQKAAELVAAAAMERDRKAAEEKARKEQEEIDRNRKQFEEDFKKSQQTPGFWSYFDRTIYRDPTPQVRHPLMRMQSETAKQGAYAGGEMTGAVGAVVTGVAAAAVLVAVGSLAIYATAALLAEAGALAAAANTARSAYVLAVRFALTRPQLAEFLLTRVLTITLGGGITAYLKNLETTQGKLEFLHDVVFILANVPTSGGSSGGGGGEEPLPPMTARGTVTSRNGNVVEVHVDTQPTPIGGKGATVNPPPAANAPVATNAPPRTPPPSSTGANVNPNVGKAPAPAPQNADVFDINKPTARQTPRPNLGSGKPVTNLDERRPKALPPSTVKADDLPQVKVSGAPAPANDTDVEAQPQLKVSGMRDPVSGEPELELVEAGPQGSTAQGDANADPAVAMAGTRRTGGPGRTARTPPPGRRADNPPTTTSRTQGRTAARVPPVTPAPRDEPPKFGKREPSLRNAAWGPPPDTGNPAADKFEQSQRFTGKNSLYVTTGKKTDNGGPELVEFDDYRQSDGMLIDAKARVGKAGSIYDVREPKATPDKPGFRQAIVRSKVMKQEAARQETGAKGVVWVVQDPEIGAALQAFFDDNGWTTFHVEQPKGAKK